MDLLSPSRRLEKSPFKDVTNSTPTPGIGAVSPRKLIKSTDAGSDDEAGSAHAARAELGPRLGEVRLMSVVKGDGNQALSATALIQHPLETRPVATQRLDTVELRGETAAGYGEVVRTGFAGRDLVIHETGPLDIRT